MYEYTPWSKPRSNCLLRHGPHSAIQCGAQESLKTGCRTIRRHLLPDDRIRTYNLLAKEPSSTLCAPHWKVANWKKRRFRAFLFAVSTISPHLLRSGRYRSLQRANFGRSNRNLHYLVRYTPGKNADGAFRHRSNRRLRHGREIHKPCNVEKRNIYFASRRRILLTVVGSSPASAPSFRQLAPPARAARITPRQSASAAFGTRRRSGPMSNPKGRWPPP